MLRVRAPSGWTVCVEMLQKEKSKESEADE